MKTIDSIARQLANIKPDVELTDEERYYNANCVKYDLMVQAIQMAQEWIPVEKELPPINEEIPFFKKYAMSDMMLCTPDRLTIYLGSYNNLSKEWDIKGTSVYHPIKFWKPLSLKLK